MSANSTILSETWAILPGDRPRIEAFRSMFSRPVSSPWKPAPELEQGGQPAVDPHRTSAGRSRRSPSAPSTFPTRRIPPGQGHPRGTGEGHIAQRPELLPIGLELPCTTRSFSEVRRCGLMMNRLLTPSTLIATSASDRLTHVKPQRRGTPISGSTTDPVVQPSKVNQTVGKASANRRAGPLRADERGQRVQSEDGTRRNPVPLAGSGPEGLGWRDEEEQLQHHGDQLREVAHVHVHTGHRRRQADGEGDEQHHPGRKQQEGPGHVPSQQEQHDDCLRCRLRTSTAMEEATAGNVGGDEHLLISGPLASSATGARFMALRKKPHGTRATSNQTA